MNEHHILPRKDLDAMIIGALAAALFNIQELVDQRDATIADLNARLSMDAGTNAEAASDAQKRLELVREAATTQLVIVEAWAQDAVTLQHDVIAHWIRRLIELTEGKP